MAPAVHQPPRGPMRLIQRWEDAAAGMPDTFRSRVVIGVVYLVVAAAVTVPIIFGGGTALSRIDEPTHADYAYRISHFEVPAKGSPIAPEIRDSWACRGQERYDLPACGVKAPPWQFPYAGENYNWPHPPVYYAMVGFPARALDAITPMDFIDAARLTGAVWLAAGMLMLYVALRRWKVDPVVALIGPILMLTFPRVLHAATTVNPDAVAPLAGAAALWLAARLFLEGNQDWVLPAVFAGAAGTTKFISVIPFVALALLAMARAVRDKGLFGVGWRDWRLPVATAAAIVVPYLLWQAIQAPRGNSWWENPLVGINTRDVVGLPGSEWIETLFVGLNLASDYYMQPPLDISLLLMWTRLLNVLVIGAMFATVVAFAKEPARRSLGWLLLAGAVLYPLAVQIQAYGTPGVPQYFPNPTGRYGLALIPGVIACLVMAVTKAGYRRLLYVLTGGGLVVVIVVIVAGFQRAGMMA